MSTYLVVCRTLAAVDSLGLMYTLCELFWTRWLSIFESSSGNEDSLGLATCLSSWLPLVLAAALLGPVLEVWVVGGGIRTR